MALRRQDRVPGDILIPEQMNLWWRQATGIRPGLSNQDVINYFRVDKVSDVVKTVIQNTFLLKYVKNNTVITASSPDVEITRSQGFVDVEVPKGAWLNSLNINGTLSDVDSNNMVYVVVRYLEELKVNLSLGTALYPSNVHSMDTSLVVSNGGIVTRTFKVTRNAVFDWAVTKSLQKEVEIECSNLFVTDWTINISF